MGIYPKGTQRKYLLVFLKALQNGIMMRIRLINQHFLNIHAFQFAQSVAFFDIPLYHWRINPESIGHRYTENRVEVDRQIYEELIKIGNQYQLSPEYYEAVDAKVITNMINLGHRCLFHSKREGNLFSKIKYAREVLNS